ncbi:hypothetical protein ABOM_008792 [Aspergillus bombycis]|uniref:NADP-dependent oxidoreductase domain-containing protein n=1 Tax=Aspergillus bombycis TaxID=109264 RepID=A0A1F7ZW51_9EURO|nr:hypothetical protein ABOM_008792 [Aspergillus bombycis]OGM43676.1 hypothetical protein ABOM_008792 [Aspergillus bombycis]
MLSSTTTRAGVHASIEEYNYILGRANKIDIFGPVHIDCNVPAKETLGHSRNSSRRVKGLSEVDTATIRRAHAVPPISAVEVEFSLWSANILTNGAVDICKELGIPILVYTPLGYGFLIGQVTKLEDIPKGDIHHMFGQFQPAASLDSLTWKATRWRISSFADDDRGEISSRTSIQLISSKCSPSIKVSPPRS